MNGFVSTLNAFESVSHPLDFAARCPDFGFRRVRGRFPRVGLVFGGLFFKFEGDFGAFERGIFQKNSPSDGDFRSEITAKKAGSGAKSDPILDIYKIFFVRCMLEQFVGAQGKSRGLRVGP